MDLPFLDFRDFLGNQRKRRRRLRGTAVDDAFAQDPEGVAELLAECEALRAQASSAGVELDDSARSLEELDQLLPRWRERPEEMSSLGNDAGLYLGTVIVRTVPGARWQMWSNGHPVVLLASGEEVDVTEIGHDWVDFGTPELSQAYAEASEE